VNWWEQVEQIRKEHNGIFGVRLFLGHDGHNVCRFDTYDETLAEGESGRSMQEAVDRCIAAWSLEAGARWFARNPERLADPQKGQP
jgi:hypothetical protein